MLAAGAAVRAPKASAEWLTPANVEKYWKESLPLRSSRTAYLVVPAGIDDIDCSLEDGQKIDWHGWSLQVVASRAQGRMVGDRNAVDPFKRQRAPRAPRPVDLRYAKTLVVLGVLRDLGDGRSLHTQIHLDGDRTRQRQRARQSDVAFVCAARSAMTRTGARLFRLLRNNARP